MGEGDPRMEIGNLPPMKKFPSLFVVFVVQYLGVENIRGAERVYVPLGGNSPQLVLPVNPPAR